MNLSMTNDKISAYFNGDNSNIPFEEFMEALGRPLVSGNFIVQIKDLNYLACRRIQKEEVGPNNLTVMSCIARELADKVRIYMTCEEEDKASSAVDCLEALRKLYSLSKNILSK